MLRSCFTHFAATTMAYQRQKDGTTVLISIKDNLSRWEMNIQTRLRKKELWKVSIEKGKATTAKCWALHPEKAPEWFKKQKEDKKDKKDDEGASAAKYAFAF